jgi:ABC-2 type transport system permease protein
VLESIRGLLVGSTVGPAAFWAVGWCLLIIVAAMALAGWLFRRRAGAR